MAIKILKIEQTDNWCEAIRNKVKRIFGVYLFDSKRRVHCCEFTPSYECVFVESQAEFFDASDDAEIENIEEEIRRGDSQTDMVSYLHCHKLESFPRFKIRYLPKENAGVAMLRGLKSRTAEKRLEEAMAYARICQV
ncbi:TPA: hypothetical protein DDW35_02430 [Candidatus Sumerlaeota bacterium]|nr:hypothetical protein [Candidatus Sumerlaeota bacterium]